MLQPASDRIVHANPRQVTLQIRLCISIALSLSIAIVIRAELFRVEPQMGLKKNPFFYQTQKVRSVGAASLPVHHIGTQIGKLEATRRVDSNSQLSMHAQFGNDCGGILERYPGSVNVVSVENHQMPACLQNCKFASFANRSLVIADFKSTWPPRISRRPHSNRQH